MTHLELIGVTHTGNRLQARFVHTFTGAVHTLDADQVAIEAGSPPVQDLHNDLSACLQERGATPIPAGITRIGGAVTLRDIHAAMREAHLAARLIWRGISSDWAHLRVAVKNKAHKAL